MCVYIKVYGTYFVVLYLHFFGVSVMDGVRRKKMQRMFDMQTLSSMYLRGVRQMDMAKELGVSISTVERDLQKLRGEWHESANYNFQSAKMEQLAKIDEIERAAWEAYEASRREKRKVTHFDEKVNPRTVTQKDEAGAGDAKWLDKISWCVEQRCKILGFHAPKEVAMTHSKIDRPLEELSKEELMMIAQRRKADAAIAVESEIMEVSHDGE